MPSSLLGRGIVSQFQREKVKTDHFERQSALLRSFSSRYIPALGLSGNLRKGFPLSEAFRNSPTNPSTFPLLILGFFLGVLELSSPSTFGRFGGAGGYGIMTGTWMIGGRNCGGSRYPGIPGPE